MPEASSTRPMTSKQAKRAYHKAGGRRFTEKELRQQKRAAELWDREQRIKEREKKRKENKIKRTKKEEKEREARRKAGLPEKPEGYISPRQTRLGVFFGKGNEEGQVPETGKDSTEGDEEGSDQQMVEDDFDQDMDQEELDRQVDGLETNQHINEEESYQQLDEEEPFQQLDEDMLDVAMDEEEYGQQRDCNSPIKENSNRPRSMSREDVPDEKALQEVTPNPPSRPLYTSETISQPNGSRVLLNDLDWLDRLPSDSQVERELSCDIIPSSHKSQLSTKSSSAKSASSQHPAAEMCQADVEAALACISSQFEWELSSDSGLSPPGSQTTLEYPTAVVPQVAPQPDFQQTMAFISTQDFIFTEEEMQELTTPAKVHDVSNGPLNLADFGVSTQEFFMLDD